MGTQQITIPHGHGFATAREYGNKNPNARQIHSTHYIRGCHCPKVKHR